MCGCSCCGHGLVRRPGEATPGVVTGTIRDGTCRSSAPPPLLPHKRRGLCADQAWDVDEGDSFGGPAAALLRCAAAAAAPWTLPSKANIPGGGSSSAPAGGSCWCGGNAPLAPHSGAAMAGGASAAPQLARQRLALSGCSSAMAPLPHTACSSSAPPSEPSSDGPDGRRRRTPGDGSGPQAVRCCIACSTNGWQWVLGLRSVAACSVAASSRVEGAPELDAGLLGLSNPNSLIKSPRQIGSDKRASSGPSGCTIRLVRHLRAVALPASASNADGATRTGSCAMRAEAAQHWVVRQHCSQRGMHRCNVVAW